MTTKKYKLLPDHILVVDETTLYRIKAMRDFGDVKAGDLGGYIEKEANLSHYGNVFGNARARNDARVSGNARIIDQAEISGKAHRICKRFWCSKYLWRC